jgi:2-phospho-L-lactate guanylyltransferase
VKSFDAAKQRLSSLLGAGSRQALAQAMFMDVLAALGRVTAVDKVVLVTSESFAEYAAGDDVVVLTDEQEAGQSAAAEIGIRWAQAAGFERVLLVPGDTPLLDAAELGELLTGSRHEVVIVPDRHGTGTNALLLSPPDAIAPSFGPNSLKRHVELAQAGEHPFRIERVASLMHDVDTSADLTDLSAVLEAQRATAPRTRGALRQLDRARARL